MKLWIQPYNTNCALLSFARSLASACHAINMMNMFKKYQGYSLHWGIPGLLEVRFLKLRAISTWEYLHYSSAFRETCRPTFVTHLGAINILILQSSGLAIGSKFCRQKPIRKLLLCKRVWGTVQITALTSDVGFMLNYRNGTLVLSILEHRAKEVHLHRFRKSVVIILVPLYSSRSCPRLWRPLEEVALHRSNLRD